MKTHSIFKSFVFAAGLGLAPMTYAADVPRFSGGMCVSQGSWLQSALEQANVITNAVNALRDDPNCTALVRALDASPKVDPRDQNSENETASFANTYQELAAIGEFLKPNLTSSQGTPLMTGDQFRNIVFQVVFNKSYQSIKEIKTEGMSANMTDVTSRMQMVSLRLKSFVERSQKVANLAMSTSKGILAALPQSRQCLHNRPSETMAILGAVAHSAAALTSGGQMNGVGEFVASLLQYSRDMSYVNAQQPMEVERFRASISCLVESTSESYCALNDGEEALDFLKNQSLADTRKRNLEEVISNSSVDPVANPLAGMIIIMRDLKELQSWMQRVLFGINPRVREEANMKNSYWTSYLTFVTKMNSIQANFRDKESLYHESTRGATREQKLGQIKEILTGAIGDMGIGGGGFGRSESEVNFFSRAFSSATVVPFELLGVTVPPTLSAAQTFEDSFWPQYVAQGEGLFRDPEQLLGRIRENVWRTMERAQTAANAFFASRMVVDPHNLITEATKGPGVSAFDALVNIKTYLVNLRTKLERSVNAPNSRLSALHKQRIAVHISLIRDTEARAEKMIEALRNAANIQSVQGGSSADIQSQEAMNVIYEGASMMLARDSLFATRLSTLVQMDISDTLWSATNITEKQSEYLMSLGPDLVNRMTSFFGANPATQRSDLNAAKIIHLANLNGTEELFSKVIFNQIVKITCQLEGGTACSMQHFEFDPAKNQPQLRMFNENLQAARRTRDFHFVGLYFKFNNWMHPVTEDSQAHVQTKAKLCIQALAFKSRNKFAEICRGAALKSDFADASDTYKLNLDFTDELAKIEAIANNKTVGNAIDRSRNMGVCALRTYFRKNQLFYLYNEYRNGQ